MVCRFLEINGEQDWKTAFDWLAGRDETDGEAENIARSILARVLEKGDAALVEYSRKFDCPDFEPPFAVPWNEIARVAASVPVESREHICAAAANIRNFHEAQLEKSWFITRQDGSILGQRVLPVDSVGLYVPGGQGGNTPLISSLLMNVIPAQVAGVPRIAICTPPRKDGSINPHILAAAHLLDIDEVYRVGGAWSIAALGFGTESIKRVDVIAGPGNIYVAAAKRILHGKVGIDMIAGPSEVVIAADSSANPAWIAADMLSQAEHDALASAICVTDDATLAYRVGEELENQLQDLPRAAIAQSSLEKWGCIAVTTSMNMALAISNFLAPEHLEICVRDPWSLLPHVRHAGAIFLGQHSPESVGDYFAGPNHVLPTLGTARFSSALSVGTFCKKSSIIAASRRFLRENAMAIAAMARMEGLEAHARSVEVRGKSRLY